MSCKSSCCCRTEINPVNLTFRVLDNDGCPVCGAVFRLLCDNEAGQFTHAMSGRNGNVTFCNVCPGTYFLTQIATAFGHEFDEDAEDLVVTVARNGAVKIDGIALYCFNIFNPREPSEESNVLQPPHINPVAEGDVTISGTGEPCCKIEVYFPRCKCCCTMVNRDGTWCLDVPCNISLEDGNVITAELCCDCRPRSAPGEVVVGDGEVEDEIEDIEEVGIIELRALECF